MRRLPISVLLLGTLALLTGCARNPVSPDLTGAAQGGAQGMGLQADDMPAGVEGGNPAFAQVSLDINKEGRLTVGRFTLELHKNSLRRPATITMRVASDDATEVEFEVVPAEANDFKVAPKLLANMSDRPATNWSSVGMWAWKNASWEALSNVSVNSAQKTVMAQSKQLQKTRVAEPEEIGVVATEGMQARN